MRQRYEHVSISWRSYLELIRKCTSFISIHSCINILPLRRFSHLSIPGFLITLSVLFQLNEPFETVINKNDQFEHLWLNVPGLLGVHVLRRRSIC